MWTEVQNSLNSLLPAKRKTTSGGWISFNAPCCVHNGETPDTRGRGGVILNGEGTVNYHCFNCGFKANYTPGRQLNYKFRKLLQWMGADDNTIHRLVIEALRVKELISPEEVKKEEVEIVIKPRPLPKEAVSFEEWLDTMDPEEGMNTYLSNAMHYALDRKVDIGKYELYWTPEVQYNLHKRVILPITWRGKTMGYTARATDPTVKPKYHSSFEPGVVFNLDQQKIENKIVVVAEGPFDALAIDGVAVMGSEVSDVQAELIEDLDKTVIVVADTDSAGDKLIESALKYGWQVSFPVWQKDYKDIAEAVEHLGKLFVLQSIIKGVERNPLKIKLRRKMDA